jgi:hypothetical protein
LQVIHSIGSVSLAKKCLIRLQFDDCPAKSGACEKGGSVECGDLIARQNKTSMQAICRGQSFSGFDRFQSSRAFQDRERWHFLEENATRQQRSGIKRFLNCCNRKHDQSLSIIAFEQSACMVCFAQLRGMLLELSPRTTQTGGSRLRAD